MRLTWPFGQREPHTLAGAYALDALDGQDRQRFERHMAGCDACAQEVTELRETTARLGTATAVSPPLGMKAKVLAAATRTSQHTPAVPRRSTRRAVLVAAPAMAAAAALIVIATIFGLASSDANQRLDQAQQRNQAIAAVLTATDATMMTRPVTGGGHATVVMSHHMDALVFTAADLPALPASQCYELWLSGPGGDRPAGMLIVSGHGMVSPVITGRLRAGDHLMLSVEPLGGTPRPTTPMMLDVPL